jgi:hypothetical protein
MLLGLALASLLALTPHRGERAEVRMRHDTYVKSLGRAAPGWAV